MSEEQQKSSINWGGLTKGLLATGAIVLGAELLCNGLITDTIQGLSNIGTPSTGGGLMSGAVKGILNALSASGAFTALGGAMSAVITKVVGAVIAYKGAAYLLSDKSEANNAHEHAARYAEEKESFAMREDIRKMQALMQMRMAAAGQDPNAGMARA